MSNMTRTGITFPQAVHLITGMPIAIAERGWQLSQAYAKGKNGDNFSYHKKLDTVCDGRPGIPGLGVDDARKYVLQELIACFGDVPEHFESVLRAVEQWTQSRNKGGAV
jgi:hypothetical protein